MISPIFDTDVPCANAKPDRFMGYANLDLPKNCNIQGDIWQ